MIDPAQLHEQLEVAVHRSQYDTVYRAMARRSERFADVTDRNPALQEIMLLIVKGFIRYCELHNLDPETTDVNAVLNPDGKIVVTISDEPIPTEEELFLAEAEETRNAAIAVGNVPAAAAVGRLIADFKAGRLHG